MAFANGINRRGRFKDMTGLRCNRLLVVGVAKRAINGTHILWECVCDCGKTVIVASNGLRSGRSGSCGCRQRDQASSSNRTHGSSQTSLYAVWNMMIQRCENERSKDFGNYGGRGIRVCDEWRKSFEQFAKDVGERPSGKYSLDRFPDKSGDYTPGNVRWATQTEQMRNTRVNRLLTVRGETKCVTEFASQYGISRKCIAHRLQRGWSDEKAVLSPLDSRRGKHLQPKPKV